MIQRLKKVPHTEALKEFNLFKLSRRRLRSHLITLGNTFTRRNQWSHTLHLLKRQRKAWPEQIAGSLKDRQMKTGKKNCFVTIIVQKILTRIGESLAFHIFKSGLNVLEIVSITGLGKEVTQ